MKEGRLNTDGFSLIIVSRKILKSLFPGNKIPDSVSNLLVLVAAYLMILELQWNGAFLQDSFCTGLEKDDGRGALTANRIGCGQEDLSWNFGNLSKEVELTKSTSMDFVSVYHLGKKSQSANK